MINAANRSGAGEPGHAVAHDTRRLPLAFEAAEMGKRLARGQLKVAAFRLPPEKDGETIDCATGLFSNEGRKRAQLNLMPCLERGQAWLKSAKNLSMGGQDHRFGRERLEAVNRREPFRKRIGIRLAERK